MRRLRFDLPLPTEIAPTCQANGPLLGQGAFKIVMIDQLVIGLSFFLGRNVRNRLPEGPANDGQGGQPLKVRN
ncbi:MAG: hypothetical protein KDN05_02220, partial [Verrucomicrobiae bacterium]|nr:hypothetical protein [Verrucomicrobiae bacterium]